MKGDPKIIKQLNAVLKNELTAVNQYFLHARMLKNWGLLRLAGHVYEESIGEMKHADMLIERVLFLEGLPNLQDLHKLSIGETVPEMFKADLVSEKRNRELLLPAMGDCEKIGDFQSKEILRRILEDTEEHIDWLETQLSVIDRIGLEAYEQEQLYDGKKE